MTERYVSRGPSAPRQSARMPFALRLLLTALLAALLAGAVSYALRSLNL